MGISRQENTSVDLISPLDTDRVEENHIPSISQVLLHQHCSGLSESGKILRSFPFRAFRAIVNSLYYSNSLLLFAGAPLLQFLAVSREVNKPPLNANNLNLSSFFSFLRRATRSLTSLLPSQKPVTSPPAIFFFFQRKKNITIASPPLFVRRALRAPARCLLAAASAPRFPHTRCRSLPAPRPHHVRPGASPGPRPLVPPCRLPLAAEAGLPAHFAQRRP